MLWMLWLPARAQAPSKRSRSRSSSPAHIENGNSIYWPTGKWLLQCDVTISHTTVNATMHGCRGVIKVG